MRGSLRLAFFAFCALFLCSACDSELARKNASLERRVAELESRVADMEQALKEKKAAEASVASSTRNSAALASKEQKKFSPKLPESLRKAKLRSQADSDNYSREDIQAIEELYRKIAASSDLAEIKGYVEAMLSHYPKSNRCGCAVLRLGRNTPGEEGVDLLKRAIGEFGDCYYGNGIQIASFGRFCLASRYASMGEKEKALALIEETKRDYPDAMSSGGQELAPELDALAASLKK